MNIHHLELFYYVAKYKGIAEAVRKMPYGIQQPAMSSQLISLEENLGVKLFHRRPYSLTPAGEELYEFITPFFGNLQEVADRISGYGRPLLKVASTPSIVRDHLPHILRAVRKQEPQLKVNIRETEASQTEEALRRHEVDLALSFTISKPSKSSTGLNFKELTRRPLMLVFRKGDYPQFHEKTSPLEVLKTSIQNEQSLISLPSNSAMYKIFQKELSRKQLSWEPEVEVNSLDLVHAYVADGYGVGLSVHVEQKPWPAKFKNLVGIPLKSFAPLVIGIFWQGKMTPLQNLFTQEAMKHVSANYS